MRIKLKPPCHMSSHPSHISSSHNSIIMKHEQEASYQSLKTPKLFLSSVEQAFHSKDGDRMANSFRQLYFTNHYHGIPPKQWQISIHVHSFQDQDNLGPSFVRMLELVRDYCQERAAEHWSECFQKHMGVLVALLRVLEEMREMKLWMAKSLVVVMRATKSLFLLCQGKVNSSSSAAKLKNSLFNTLQRYKTSKAMDEVVRREFLSLVDVMQVSILLFFHNYEQIQRILYSNKIYGEVSPRHIDNFHFQKGKYALINENFTQAEACFLRVNLRTHKQWSLVMRYLIPCRIFLGNMYTGRGRKPGQIQEQQQVPQFQEYLSIIEAIKSADFGRYQELSRHYQKVWLKRGIYLLMDRARVMLWRTLVKGLWTIVGNKIDLELIERAVQARGGSEGLSECICIVGNLIYEGYIKGYIFQNETKRTLVLKSSGNAFPKLESIVR